MFIIVYNWTFSYSLSAQTVYFLLVYKTKLEIYNYRCAHKMCNDYSSTRTTPEKTRRLKGLWNNLFKCSD